MDEKLKDIYIYMLRHKDIPKIRVIQSWARKSNYWPDAYCFHLKGPNQIYGLFFHLKSNE